MIYYIENEQLRVGVSDLGGELKSVYGKKNDFEYLWQGDKNSWKSSAPILFPICGRLKDGKYMFDKKIYEMNLHGFVRKTNLTLFEKLEDSITFELKSNEETLKQYPFHFIFRITYSLSENTLHNSFYVENVNSEDLPFSVGGHPGFNVPFEKDTKFTDYYLEFSVNEKRTKLVFDPATCLYAGKSQALNLIDDKILELDHSLFDNDAIFVNSTNDSITIKSKKSNKCVTVSYNSAYHVGIWQTPHKSPNFVCIEPWRGIPAFYDKIDDFSTKLEFDHIKKGEKFNWNFDITIKQ